MFAPRNAASILEEIFALTLIVSGFANADPHSLRTSILPNLIRFLYAIEVKVILSKSSGELISLKSDSISNFINFLQNYGNYLCVRYIITHKK